MIEISDLIGFGYDLSDTQDGPKCWRREFIFCGKHPLLLTNIHVSDRGPMGTLVNRVMAHLTSEKQLSMIRKYLNHTLHTYPWHCEEEPQNTDCHKTSEGQLK